MWICAVCHCNASETVSPLLLVRSRESAAQILVSRNNTERFESRIIHITFDGTQDLGMSAVVDKMIET